MPAPASCSARNEDSWVCSCASCLPLMARSWECSGHLSKVTFSAGAGVWGGSNADWPWTWTLEPGGAFRLPCFLAAWLWESHLTVLCLLGLHPDAGVGANSTEDNTGPWARRSDPHLPKGKRGSQQAAANFIFPLRMAEG